VIRGGAGGAQARDDPRQVCDPHVEDHRVIGSRERIPVERLVVECVACRKSDALRKPAVGERHTGARRRAKRRGDARHDEVGDVVRREHLDLFAAAAKYERIAALQAGDAQSGARVVNHELVNARLRVRWIARLLADENALRIAARKCEHRIRHQSIVEDDVGLLQQLQRAQCEQIRIAGAGADEINLTHLSARTGAAELRCECLVGARLIAGEHLRAYGAANNALPERPAAGGREGKLHRRATLAHEARERTELRRQQCFDLRAHAPHQHRRASAGADRHDDRRAIDDGREDEA
jgi:hypothetical protein